MRLTLSIAGGLLLAVGFAIAGGLAWFAHPTLREWPFTNGYSPVALGSPMGGVLGVMIWSLAKNKAWARSWMVVLGFIGSVMAFPGFHDSTVLSDGWDSLREELTFYFWLVVFCGCLSILFAGIVATFRSRLRENMAAEQGGADQPLTAP
jgi:hypothetical protein